MRQKTFKGPTSRTLVSPTRNENTHLHSVYSPKSRICKTNEECRNQSARNEVRRKRYRKYLHWSLRIACFSIPVCFIVGRLLPYEHLHDIKVVQYTVQPGDTLWDIVHRADPDIQNIDVISWIENRDHLGQNADIYPGEVLALPINSSN